MKAIIGVAIVAIGLGVSWQKIQTIQKEAFDACADVYHERPKRKESPYIRTSDYFRMNDGTRIAYDAYVPVVQQPQADRIFLHFTRYNRRSVIRWPFNHILGANTINGRSKDYVNELVARNIPVVSVDVRGTGASFGSRPIDLHPDEIQDLIQVLHQAKHKFCHNLCKVSTGGISYDGIIGLWLAAEAVRDDPESALGVDSVAVLFSPLDIYDDIAFVGGIRNIFFLDDYNLFVSALERSQIPRGLASIPYLTQFFLNYVIGGPAPVDQDENGDLLNQAIAQHQANWDFKKETADQFYKDDVNKMDSSGRELMVKGIQGAQIDAIAQANSMRVFFYAGTHDAASIAAAERFAARSAAHGVITPVVFGSWTHGLRKSNSPFDVYAKARGYLPCYEMYAAVGDYFTNQTMDTKSYAFVTGAEEFWDFETWPPLDSVVDEKHIQLSEWSSPGDSIRTVSTQNTSSPQSHHPTRWNLVHAALKVNVDPSTANVKPVTEFTSDVVKSPLAVIGTVVLKLKASPVQGEDLAVFAALDEITAQNDTVMITEAVVDARHQCVDAVPKESLPTPTERKHCVRSYFREDYTRLSQAPIPIFFQPVAHQFAAGSRIRLRLHAYNEGFRLRTPPAEQWTIDLDQSTLILPIVESK